MKRIWKRFKEEFEEDPAKMLMVCAGTMTAAAMLTNAYVNYKKNRVWAQEVNRRDRMTR